MVRLNKALILVLLSVAFPHSLFAIHLGANDNGDPLPWSRPLSHSLDEPVNKKYNGKAFFMNLGPTGIRAIIEKNNPKSFKVMFVFQDRKSPAKGLVFSGDYIIGANGKKFKDPHGFHRKEGGRGWPGPPFELAHAIEDSQGKDGKLSLLVRKGGAKAAVKTVVLQLEPKGRFSKTYPWNCPRSDKLRKELVTFMLDNNPSSGRLWLQIQYALALMASGDRRGISFAKDLGRRLTDIEPDIMTGGMATWTWGYQGIMLGEYYSEFKDGSVKSAAKALAQCYETGQTFSNGGFSHRPFPAIERRVAGGGSKGYGAMAGPGGLSMLAQSLFRLKGLPYSPMAYQRTHEAFLLTAGGNPSGAIAYGFKGIPTARIQLLDPKSPCKSKLGIGFQCPTGMTDIGDFKVEEWTQKGEGDWDMKLQPSSKFPWPTSKWDKIQVYQLGKNTRLAVYPEPPDEPRRSYKTDERGGGHNAPVGMGAAAHIVGNSDNKSWGYLGKHMATCCAFSPHTMWDGHAAGEMHAFFSVVGASWADEKDLRHFLDYAKTWVILSESHDGEGLIDQPFGCQRNSTCSIGLNRMAYTHVGLLLLSLNKRNLVILGKDAGLSAPARVASSSYSSRSSGSSATGPTVTRTLPKGFTPFQVPRGPRKLTKGSGERLEKTLHKVLLALSSRKTVKSQKMKISKFGQKVYFGAVYPDGTVSFKNGSGKESKKYAISDLTDRDVSKLAALAAEVSPTNDLYALAGVLQERAGRMGNAAEYYEKAGVETKQKFDRFFAPAP